MSKWTTWRDKIIKKILTAIGWYEPTAAESYIDTPDAGEEVNVKDNVKYADEMPAVMLASCWDGANASKRMMNLTSPKMSEAKAKEYISWMVAKGCNTAHVFLTNQGDGECAGFDGRNASDAQVIKERMEMCRKAGLYVVPWLVADDSASLNKDFLASPCLSVQALVANGLLAGCRLVVLGLEMDEYGDNSQFAAVKSALITYAGTTKFGTHHTSGRHDFAALGEYVFDQLDPSKATEATVKASVKALIAKGKKVVGFEYARGPAQKLAQAALDAGAVGVGNWDGKATATAATATAATATAATQTSTMAAVDAADFASLDWCYGGFKGGKAELDTRCKLSSLRCTSDMVYFKWESGIPADWKRSDTNKGPMVLFGLFCHVDGKWKGGKLDWVDEARSSRDLKNVRDYCGWSRAAYDNADAYAICVVSADGKRRSNVIVTAR